MSRYFNDDELYHHGILGMHWGVRRYQNYDGTLKGKSRKKKRSSALTGLAYQSSVDNAKSIKGDSNNVSESAKAYNQRSNALLSKHPKATKLLAKTDILDSCTDIDELEQWISIAEDDPESFKEMYGL